MDNTQKVMDETHDRWQANDWDYEEFLHHLTTKELVVVVLAKLNYQVENGGFDQWFENGYGDQSRATLDCLTVVGTETAKKAFELVGRALERRRNTVELNELDSLYYEINNQLMQDLERWVSTTN